AAELGGRAVSFHDWPKIFEPIDIVISCTAAPDYLIDRTLLGPLMKERKNRPLLLIDIAVPRDVQPEVNLLDNVYLYNIDDLQSIADSYLRSRQEEIAHCEKIIREKIRALLGRRGESDSSVSGGLALGKS
ncbi:MAG TPA: glutamyl-tRNA reductase, partial [Candidatus Paceibacterota bacterium]|nr:glutamyl-tRNA reductase [Candidatus Paceibacterota bacterium]